MLRQPEIYVRVRYVDRIAPPGGGRPGEGDGRVLSREIEREKERGSERKPRRRSQCRAPEKSPGVSEITDSHNARARARTYLHIYTCTLHALTQRDVGRLLLLLRSIYI